MIVYYISHPDVPMEDAGHDDLFLCGGRFTFTDISAETAEALNAWLESVYGKGKKGSYKEAVLNMVYTDGNGNTAEIYYKEPEDLDHGGKIDHVNGSMHITYSCGDAYQQYLGVN